MYHKHLNKCLKLPSVRSDPAPLLLHVNRSPSSCSSKVDFSDPSNLVLLFFNVRHKVLSFLLLSSPPFCPPWPYLSSGPPHLYYCSESLIWSPCPQSLLTLAFSTPSPDMSTKVQQATTLHTCERSQTHRINDAFKRLKLLNRVPTHFPALFPASLFL